MAVTNKFLSEGDRDLHMNPEREAFRKEAKGLSDLETALGKLVDFRTVHIGPQRETYEKEFDSMWMEAELEGQVAMLKSRKFTGKEYLDKCACGASADEVLADWMAKADAAEDDLIALENLAVEYRRGFKPPIMPANHWLEGDSHLSGKLLVKRSGYVDKMSIEELREMRGVKVVSNTLG
jgi:methane monooxygenase component A gamma chain